MVQNELALDTIMEKRGAWGLASFLVHHPKAVLFGNVWKYLAPSKTPELLEIKSPLEHPNVSYCTTTQRGIFGTSAHQRSSLYFIHFFLSSAVILVHTEKGMAAVLTWDSFDLSVNNCLSRIGASLVIDGIQKGHKRSKFLVPIVAQPFV